jgi:nucleoside-diphosphate kinase
VNAPGFEQSAQFLTQDVVVGLELVAENAVEKFQNLLVPLRNQFGTDAVRDAVHCSGSNPAAQRELNYFFTSCSPAPQLTNCTCAIIKPHAIMNSGKIIDWILSAGYEISALVMYNLDRPTANEFFEVYKGVLPEFVPLVDHMTTGACIALEIRQENAV